MQVSKWIASVIIGTIAATFAMDAEAQRRLGGGKNLGKQSPQVQQRQATPPAQSPQQAPQNTPGQQPAAAAPVAAGGAAAAARSASPMRGALIGLAAGLGLMALASWLGFGETLATIMMFALFGLILALIVGFVLRRMRGNLGPQPAYGTPQGTLGKNVGYEAQPAPQPLQRSASQPAPAGGARPGSAMDQFLRGGAVNPGTPWGIPAGFDTEGFLANARIYFGKLQSAWEDGNLDQLADFTTSDMFIALTHELRARAAAGKVEVVQLEATLLGIESLPAEHVASVRFVGQLTVDGVAEPVDEVWNLSKAADGKGGWLLAGIQQLA